MSSVGSVGSSPLAYGISVLKNTMGNAKPFSQLLEQQGSNAMETSQQFLELLEQSIAVNNSTKAASNIGIDVTV